MVNQLSDEQRAVLEHVLRYRLTVPRTLAATGIVSEEGEDAARQTLTNLQQNGWLRSADLYPGHRQDQYFHLSDSAAQYLGQDPVVARPLKHDMRVESFAIATFCCCGDKFRQLLTKEEFKSRLPDLWYTGQPVRYYLEEGEDQVVRLAFIKVDTAGAGRWDRLIDSCNRFLRQRVTVSLSSPKNRTQVQAFAKLVDQGRFQFTVLTAMNEKKRAIELELERRVLAGEPVPPMQVHVVPGMFHVLFPAPQPG